MNRGATEVSRHHGPAAASADGAAPSGCIAHTSRRTALRLMLGTPLALAAVGTPGLVSAAAFTKEERDKLTPDQVIEMSKQGNERFRTGKMQAHDYLEQKRATAAGQYPAAAILSCIDSRAPAEIILDV